MDSIDGGFSGGMTRGMPFDWKSYFVLAQYLAESVPPGCSPEAAKRSAISRAYYAAFGEARRYAEARLGFQRRGQVEDHKRLRECFVQKGGKWKEVAMDLNRLRRLRNACDYEDEVSDLSSATRFALQMAARLMQSCR